MPFKYRAFLSYRSIDTAQAQRLHRKLEAYVVPRPLSRGTGRQANVPRRIGRVFRDRDEARAAERIERVIADELSQSQDLIVLCSPAAAAPDSWVHREIELFRQLRPDGRIHAVIGAGEPPTCFPPSLLTRREDGSSDAPLAADFRANGMDGVDKAVVRLVAALLGVAFDDLWRREERRRRFRLVVKAAELSAAAVATAGVALLGNYYRTHAMVRIDVAPLHAIASDVRIRVSEESPASNDSRIVIDRALTGTTVRLRVPAANLIIRVLGTYRDGEPRSLAHHLTLTPGFALRRKSMRLALPPVEELRNRPGMAHVPATFWLRGSENESRHHNTPFWIDIRPPTVVEYVPVAQRLLRSGQLQAENSYLLTAMEQSSAIDRTGTGQLRELNQSLGAIMGVIARGSEPLVSAPGDLVAGAAPMPCDSCPAPMTRVEAVAYCASRGMRLPTASEWELAVRGVDGRTYPWGNRFDATRANVPGLPQDDVPVNLASVFAHRDYVSPFGLFDTVGNAGDWVENDVSSYEAVYMGATYRFNPEDATVFRMLPVTDADVFVREITARCAVDGRNDGDVPRR